MGVTVTLKKTENFTDNVNLSFLENGTNEKQFCTIDRGNGRRKFLNYEFLPDYITNSGVFIPGITNEALCYENGLGDHDKSKYDLYEFDNSGWWANEIKLFPGWKAFNFKTIPDYGNEYIRQGQECLWKRIDHIPTPDNIYKCCTRNSSYCRSNLVNNYQSSTCDHTMLNKCIVNNDIWNDSNCKDWMEQQVRRPNKAFYDAVLAKAKSDFTGIWGRFIWDLGIYDPHFYLLHDLILEQHCSEERPECVCKNKKGFGTISKNLATLPAPIECMAVECKSTHPRFLGKYGREILNSCKSVNCEINIKKLTGNMDGELILINNCLSGKNTVKTIAPKTFIPSRFIPGYITSAILILILLTLICLFFR
ncbi:myristylated protein A16L [Salmon gill poxvirus]|uniref:Myristylated protein A16L n=1 Tax=Salmon gill poxvirus TaxID=1680908 RepID=A0A0H4Y1F0_9POXV|nr:myristylated protein A16L [Salmon gill poxvirus]AKR04242.1 Myristylated protein A16L [Salmon gill poxvirus]